MLVAYFDAYGCIDSACATPERHGVCRPECAVAAALAPTPPTDAEERAAREALAVHTAPLCLIWSNCVRPRGHDDACSRTMRDNGDPWDHLRTALRLLDEARRERDEARADVAVVRAERDLAEHVNRVADAAAACLDEGVSEILLMQHTATAIARAEVRLEMDVLKQERDTAHAEVERLRIENEALRLLAEMREHKGEAVVAALDAIDDKEYAWMTRDDLLSHYLCAATNWGLTLDDVDALRGEVERLRAIEHAARVLSTRLTDRQAFVLMGPRYISAEADALRVALDTRPATGEE